MSETIELRESRNGFSQRDLHSKAILNRDADSLFKYKVQRNRMFSTSNELENINIEFNALKEELREIKALLIKFKAGYQ